MLIRLILTKKLVLYTIPIMNIPIVVIDTNVMLSALKSINGKSNQLLQEIGTGRFDFAISVPLILEYEAILKKHLDRTYYSDDDIDDFLNYLCQIGKHIKLFYLWRPYLRDGFDDHILELAIHSNSEMIITFNKKDFKEAEDLGIITLTPREFMDTLNGGQK